MPTQQSNSSATIGYEAELWAMAALRGEEIARIADTCHSWRTTEEDVARDHGHLSPLANGGGGNGYADVPGFCKAASMIEVRRHGHVLTPGRYLGVEPQEDDEEPFEDKMKRLVAELREQQVEGAGIDAAITDNLEALATSGSRAGD